MKTDRNSYENTLDNLVVSIFIVKMIFDLTAIIIIMIIIRVIIIRVTMMIITIT